MKRAIFLSVAAGTLFALVDAPQATACHRRVVRYCHPAPVYVYPSCVVVRTTSAPPVATAPVKSAPIAQVQPETRTEKSIQTEKLTVAQALAKGTESFLSSKYEDAVSYYTVAAKLDPSDVRAYKWRGIVQSNRSDQPQFDKAIADLSKASELTPNDAEIYGYLAFIYGACPTRSYRDGNKAVENAKKACELTEYKHPEFLISLATAHAQAGQFEEAVERAEQAIEIADGGNKASLQVVLAQFQRKEAIP